MRFRSPTLLVLCSALALSACDKSASFWTGEAGSAANEGGFGAPTQNNLLIQTGQLNYAVSLNKRFAAEVPTMVNFAFDSAVLDAEAQQILLRQADWIRQFPEVRFRVYGHTDLVGSNAYNKSLGMRRAQAVVHFLTAHGISRSRLEAVVSYGKTQPLIVTQDRERRNRRTVTEVSGFVKRNPTVMNGKYAEIVYREYVKSAEPKSPVAEAPSAQKPE